MKMQLSRVPRQGGWTLRVASRASLTRSTNTASPAPVSFSISILKSKPYPCLKVTRISQKSLPNSPTLEKIKRHSICTGNTPKPLLHKIQIETLPKCKKERLCRPVPDQVAPGKRTFSTASTGNRPQRFNSSGAIAAQSLKSTRQVQPPKDPTTDTQICAFFQNSEKGTKGRIPVPIDPKERRTLWRVSISRTREHVS